jgi:hypothetical protein
MNLKTFTLSRERLLSQENYLRKEMTGRKVSLG